MFFAVASFVFGVLGLGKVVCFVLVVGCGVYGFYMPHYYIILLF